MTFTHPTQSTQVNSIYYTKSIRLTNRKCSFEVFYFFSSQLQFRYSSSIAYVRRADPETGNIHKRNGSGKQYCRTTNQNIARWLCSLLCLCTRKIGCRLYNPNRMLLRWSNHHVTCAVHALPTKNIVQNRCTQQSRVFISTIYLLIYKNHFWCGQLPQRAIEG